MLMSLPNKFPRNLPSKKQAASNATPYIFILL
jgi:hypothetical protein